MEEIRNWLIALVIFAFFIVGGVSLVGLFFASDSTYGDTSKFQDFNRTFNTISDVDEKVSALKTSVESQSGSSGFDIFGVIPALVSTAWSTLSLILTSFGFMNVAIWGLNTFFGIPAFIPLILTLIVTVVIAIALYRALFVRS